MKQAEQQTILKYPAVFEPAEEGGYNVSFPAFPGCVTFGKNFEEAKQKAGEILELWIEELAESGQSIMVYNNRPVIDEVCAAISGKIKIHAPSYC